MALHPQSHTPQVGQPPALGGQPQQAQPFGALQGGQPGGLLDLLSTPQGIETFASRMAQMGVAPPGAEQAQAQGFGSLISPQAGGAQAPLIPSPANALPPGAPTIPNATGFGGVANQGQQPSFANLIGGGRF